MATVKGQVVEASKGEPLVNASVEIYNSKGTYLGQGVKTDNTGKFSFTSPILSGNYLVVSYTGLEPAFVEAEKYMSTTYKRITLFAKDLAAVTVYPKKFPWWVVIAGTTVTAVAIASKKKKKNKIGAIGTGSGFDWSKLIIPAGVVIGGFFVVRAVMEKLGLLPDEYEKEQKEQEKKAAEAQAALAKKDFKAATFTYSRETLSNVVSDLKTATSGFNYDYFLLVKSLAYVSGMRNADAQYFLGKFVEQFGYTFYQFWVKKFQDQINFIGPIPVFFSGYEEHFKHMDADPNYFLSYFAGSGWDKLVGAVVTYAYKVAGIAKQ